MAAGSYREVVDGIVAAIVSGQYPIGSRLPTVQDLEEAHGRAVAQAAIAWLVANRWVVRTPGTGSLHVAGRLPEGPGGSPAVTSGAGAAPPIDLARLARDVADLARDVAELKRWRAEREGAPPGA